MLEVMHQARWSETPLKGHKWKSDSWNVQPGPLFPAFRNVDRFFSNFSPFLSCRAQCCFSNSKTHTELRQSPAVETQNRIFTCTLQHQGNNVYRRPQNADAAFRSHRMFCQCTLSTRKNVCVNYCVGITSRVCGPFCSCFYWLCTLSRPAVLNLCSHG